MESNVCLFFLFTFILLLNILFSAPLNQVSLSNYSISYLSNASFWKENNFTVSNLSKFINDKTSFSNLTSTGYYSGYYATSKSNTERPNEQDGSVTSVVSSWRVTQAPFNLTNHELGQWIGIGGLARTDLIQVGTVSSSSPLHGLNLPTHYWAFFEILPNSSIVLGTPYSLKSGLLPLSVSYDDEIFAKISQINEINSTFQTWFVLISDLDKRWVAFGNVTYPSSRSSADFILEEPTFYDYLYCKYGCLYSFPKFGTSSFGRDFTNLNSSLATIDGITESLGSLNNFGLQMEDKGVLKATPDPLTPDGSSFWVTYGDLSVAKIRRVSSSVLFGNNALFEAMVNGGSDPNNLLYQWSAIGPGFSRTNLTSPSHNPELIFPVTHNMILGVFVTDDGASNPKPEAYNYNEINFTYDFRLPDISLSAHDANPYSVLVTLNNTQSSPIHSPFQQLLTINSTKYPINSNWTNVEFINATGVPLQAWVENNATNSSRQTQVWVRLNQDIPASGTLKIYMEVLPNNVMSSNGPTGEAPTLSPEYAEYDNGNYVFNSYDNFAGNHTPGSGTGAIDSQLRGVEVAHWKVNNGLNWSDGSVSLSNLNINGTPESWNVTVDTLSGLAHYSYCPFSQCYSYSYMCASDGWEGFNGTLSLLGYAQMTPSAWTGPCGSEFSTYNGVVEINHDLNESPVSSPYSFSLYKGRFYLQLGYSSQPIENSSTILQNGDADTFTMSTWNHGASTVTTFPWIRTRTTPPNGVMPNVSFGTYLAVQTALPASRFQTLMVIANTTTNGLAKPPYTYTYSVVNEISNEVIQTATVTTNATSYTQNFTLGSSELENFPEVVNVVVTDSTSTLLLPPTPLSSFSRQFLSLSRNTAILLPWTRVAQPLGW